MKNYELCMNEKLIFATQNLFWTKNRDNIKQTNIWEATTSENAKKIREEYHNQESPIGAITASLKSVLSPLSIQNIWSEKDTYKKFMENRIPINLAPSNHKQAKFIRE